MLTFASKPSSVHSLHLSFTGVTHLHIKLCDTYFRSSAMSRKRKGRDEVVTRVFRARPTPLLLDRTVSVHTTATGRLGQSTSFLPGSVDPALEADRDGPGPSHGSANDFTSDDFASDDFALEEDLASRTAQGNDSEGFAASGDASKDVEDSPLREWANVHRDTYLDEMMRHESRIGAHHCSGECGRDGTFKCKDCFGYRLWCHNCFVRQHSHLPLHRPLVSSHSGFKWCSMLILPLLAAMERQIFRRCIYEVARHPDLPRS